MRRILPAAVTFAELACMSLVAVPKAAALSDKSLYVVTHVDVAGRGNLTESIRLVEEFVADSRQDPGVVRFEAFQQEGHPNHFTIFEVWQNRKAFDAHSAAAHTRRFRQALQPVLGSPFRERLHTLAP
jgi:quinol monooxygenase YgiN